MKPIKHNKISNQVFDQILKEIITGKLKSGEKLPSENELSKLLGVSRVSIREALKRLAVLGMVETRQGEGTFVKTLSPGIYMNSLIPMFSLDLPSILEVLEYRKIIEVESMTFVVKRIEEEELEELEAVLLEMSNNKGNMDRFAEEDLNFHLVLSRCTKNSVIIKINEVIREILKYTMSDVVSLLGTEDGLFYHRKIIDAIKEKNVVKTKDIMAEHLDRTISRIKEVMR